MWPRLASFSSCIFITTWFVLHDDYTDLMTNLQKAHEHVHIEIIFLHDQCLSASSACSSSLPCRSWVTHSLPEPVQVNSLTFSMLMPALIPSTKKLSTKCLLSRTSQISLANWQTSYPSIGRRPHQLCPNIHPSSAHLNQDFRCNKIRNPYSCLTSDKTRILAQLGKCRKMANNHSRHIHSEKASFQIHKARPASVLWNNPLR